MSFETTPAYSPYRWPLHLLTVCYFMMGFIVRFAWPPLAGAAGPELGMDMTRIGSYMSAFYVGYVAVHIPAGVLGDRFGVRGVVTLALLVEGLASIGMGAAASYGAGFFLRLLAGFGAGMVYSSCVRCVSRWFPAKEHGLAFGLLLLAPTGGGVLLPNLLMPWLASLWTWRGAFVAVGIAALCLAVVALSVLRDIGSAAKNASFFAGLRYVLGQRALLLVSLAGFCLMWSQISFISWGNSYLKSINFSLAEAGFVMMFFGLGGCLGPLLSGFLCDRLSHPKWVMIAAFLCLIPLPPLFGALETAPALMLAAGLAGLFYGIANPPPTLIVAAFSGKMHAATAGGISGCIFQFGSILGPLCVGYSIDLTGSYASGWWMMAASAAAGICILLPTPKPPRE